MAWMRFGPAADAEHDRLRRTVDVRVEDTHTRAFGRQRERKVDRGGALADAPLTGGNGDDVLDARDELDTSLHGMRNDLHLDIDGYACDTRDGLDRPRDLLPDRLNLALPGVTQQNFDGHLVSVHLDTAHGLGADVILARIGIDEGLQRLLNLLLGDCHGEFRSKRRARF
jgi:hypothetical protein